MDTSGIMITWNGITIEATITEKLTLHTFQSVLTKRYAAIAEKTINRSMLNPVMIKLFMNALGNSISTHAVT